MAAVANALAAEGVPVVVHAMTDGRDVPPSDAVTTLPRFLAELEPGVTVGTVCAQFTYK